MKTYQEILDRWEKNNRIRNALRTIQGLCFAALIYLPLSFFPPNQGSLSGEHQQFNYARSLLARHHKILIGKTLLGCLAIGGVTEVIYQRLEAPEDWV